MSRIAISFCIIACIFLAILISLAPEHNSIYEELGTRTSRLLDTVIKLLGVIGLLKYLFTETEPSK
jgi:type II secretory pathway component PulF